mgnify:CR=1 FL=1
MKQHTQEIRQRVLESAKELLIEQGYKKTTIRGIVERSGVLTGSIYYFFKNKEAIFAEMLESIIHQCIEKIDTCCEGETAAFKFAVLCEVELKKMQDDPRIREIYFECYRSPVIFEKFVDLFAFQCSYCAPGFVNAATVLVETAQRQPLKKSEVEDRIEASLGHHICRCTGYVRYYDATRKVLNDLGLVKEG